METLDSLRHDMTELERRVVALEEKSQPKKLDFDGIEGHREHKPDFSRIPGHVEHER